MERPFPSELRIQIIEFLLSLNSYENPKSRQSFVSLAGLDNELCWQIDFDGPKVQFISHFVDVLIGYGELKNGRHALVSILETAKEWIGLGGKEYCSRFIQKVQKFVEYEQYLRQSNTCEDYDVIKYFREAYKILPIIFQNTREEYLREKEHIYSCIYKYAASISKDDKQKALEIYQEFISDDPSPASLAICEIADIHYSSTNYKAAAGYYLEYYDRIVQHKISNRDTSKVFNKLWQIEKKYKEIDTDDAYENLGKLYIDLYDIEPELNKGYLNKALKVGDKLKRKKAFLKARKIYEDIKERDTNHQQATYGICDCYIEEGLHEEAANEYIEYIKYTDIEDPLNDDEKKTHAFEGLLRIGKYYLSKSKDRYFSAIGIFRECLVEENPVIDQVLHQLWKIVETYSKEEKYDEAIEVIQDIVYYHNKRIDDHFFAEKAYLKLAELYKKSGSYDNAIKTYEEIIEPYQQTLKSYSIPEAQDKLKLQAIEIYPELLKTYREIGYENV